jgi:hypothetical protein
MNWLINNTKCHFIFCDDDSCLLLLSDMCVLIFNRLGWVGRGQRRKGAILRCCADETKQKNKWQNINKGRQLYLCIVKWMK